jgi:hypothetical protein
MATYSRCKLGAVTDAMASINDTVVNSIIDKYVHPETYT